MSDWHAGDRAECVETGDLKDANGQLHVGGRYLRHGAVYTVGRVVLSDQSGELLLDFGMKSGPKMARRFRKLPPLAERETVHREERQGDEVMA